MVYQLGNSSTIGPCQQFATILLNKRKGQSEADLHEDLQFLITEMLARNPKVTKFDLFPKQVFKQASNHLKQCFKTSKDERKPMIEVNNDFDSLLLLHYYRNGVVHLFINEAIIACSLKGFGKTSTQEGVRLDELWEKTKFLDKFLELEFIIEHRMKT